jgi:cysteine and histidine-rich domain-containing protein
MFICLGMKYWSCCQKKTTDFDAFTSQPGCTDGEHLWRTEISPSTNEDDPETLKKSCRYDFHQQGSSVVLTVYAKMPRPDQTRVELNAGRLRVNTRFGPDVQTKQFCNDWNLFGLIDVEQSTVELLQSKIEIILKKAEPLSWSRLDRPIS